MNKAIAAAVLSSAILFSLPVLSSGEEAKKEPGEALFRANCAACHPDGGNIMNPQKTLHKKDRERNGIVTAEDIIRKMRNPGPNPEHPQEWAGMKMFDEKKLSNEDAKKIAAYILKTFE